MGKTEAMGKRKAKEMRKTAGFTITACEAGHRYSFYCDASGALACTTKAYRAASPEQELQLAWETEGRQHFNQCHRCGRWVVDVAFNPDVLECVSCAPFEEEPRYCKFCGTRIRSPGRTCPVCGKLLYYEGGGGEDQGDGKIQI